MTSPAELAPTHRAIQCLQPGEDETYVDSYSHFSIHQEMLQVSFSSISQNFLSTALMIAVKLELEQKSNFRTKFGLNHTEMLCTTTRNFSKEKLSWILAVDLVFSVCLLRKLEQAKLSPWKCPKLLIRLWISSGWYTMEGVLFVVDAGFSRI